MYVLENPVLQRELLVNLRMTRGFVLLLLYQMLLGAVVFFAWPADQRLDLSEGGSDKKKAQRLTDLFFVGQFVLASLMAPSFAAGTITGEKERMTYEMLLASPLRPGAIVFGKLLASLAHIMILIFASLPIIMLCLPLGGVSFYEVLAAYLAILTAVLTFGMISVACSSYFKRTAASLVVAYLLILPIALFGVAYWLWLAENGSFRLILTVIMVPSLGLAVCIALFANTCVRLLHPPDVGSEGKEVVDLEQEAHEAIGLVIQRDQFPDMLFAPAKRDDLMEDGANPVYDKEIRSEIFSQGTLMLRLVIQVSMLLAIPLMAVCLYVMPQHAPWYISYVVVFNMLVGPVFSSGTVTSERERQTLDLLLTTTITPWQILWGKLVAGLRVSSVLTTFLLWPVLLACVMVSTYWSNLPAVAAFLGIVALTCLTTAMVALFCSVIMRKTSVAMMASYLTIVVLFCAPLAVRFFADSFHEDVYPESVTRIMLEFADQGLGSPEIFDRLQNEVRINNEDRKRLQLDDFEPALERAVANRWVRRGSLTSPFSAAFAVPLDAAMMSDDMVRERRGSWPQFAAYALFTAAFNLGLLFAMVWLFNVRWRVAS